MRLVPSQTPLHLLGALANNSEGGERPRHVQPLAVRGERERGKEAGRGKREAAGTNRKHRWRGIRVHAPRIAGTCHRRRMPTARGGQGGTTEGAAGRPTLGASCCARLLPSLCLLLSLRPAGGPIMLAPPSARTSCWHHALRARARTEAGGRSTRGMSTRGKSTCERVVSQHTPGRCQPASFAASLCRTHRRP